MSPYSENNCDFHRFLLFRNKVRNAGRSRQNVGRREISQKCGISRTIAGRLTPSKYAMFYLGWQVATRLKADLRVSWTAFRGGSDREGGMYFQWCHLADWDNGTFIS